MIECSIVPDYMSSLKRPPPSPSSIEPPGLKIHHSPVPVSVLILIKPLFYIIFSANDIKR
jgi:hypothetical protein